MKTILVTGANGFVGNELIKRLGLSTDFSIQALVRKNFQHDHPTVSSFKVLKGDLLEPDSLPALTEIDTAFYLVHGLKASDRDFEYEESLAAVNFVQWVKKKGCKRIVYLGGLGPDAHTSPHLRSRHLTGKILASSGIPCVELRASIVLAAGSTSFEMIKALGERLPFSPDFPKIENYCQPIDLDDLMKYLQDSISISIDVASSGTMVIEIGGQDKISYASLMRLYLKLVARNKKKVRIPEIDDRVFKKMLDFILPEMAEVGKKLYESLEYPTVVQSNDAHRLFPRIEPISAAMAMEKAIRGSSSVYSALWKPEMILFLIKENVIGPDDLKSILEFIPEKQKTMIELVLKSTVLRGR